MPQDIDFLTRVTMDGLGFLATLFVFVIGLVALLIVVVFVVDVSQTKDAVRRNYPVLGRFRSIFSKLGEFFRQYFFAMDREELPFNRAEREWVYSSSRGTDNTVAFGSTRSLTPVGTVIFINCPFPTLSEDSVPTPPITIGPYCDHPYEAKSLINVSGMSFGAISQPAVRALSNGAKLAGCWLNTGEGGLSPYHLEGGCDIVFQIGTAKYGVRTLDGELHVGRLQAIAERPEVKMFELKMSQGAKPGKGGILPAVKVTPEITEIRGIAVGQASGDGGTGAAPMPLMDNVGLPVKESLPMVADVLTRHGLKERIKLIASGKMVTPAEVAWAYCAGADVVVSARGFMFALGCIQALKCNKNTCPTGITTHDPRFQRGLDPTDKAVRVKNYVDRVQYDVGVIAHSCRVPHPRALKRYHCRIVQSSGKSVPLDELYPPIENPPIQPPRTHQTA